MGQISIRFSDKQEVELKKISRENNKTLAEYIRDKVLSDEIIEQPIIRESIESEIQRLENLVFKLNNNVTILSKIILKEIIMSSNLTQGFFDQVIDDDEIKQTIHKEANEESDNFIKRTFKE